MKKLLIVGGAITGAAFLARRWASSGGVDFGRPIERMPEDAPPKVDVRQHQRDPGEHTERIRQLLESERNAAD